MFSYQLYSSRNFPPLAKTLQMLAETGYRAVEGFGGLYADQAGLTDLHAGLQACGLKMPSGHFGFDFYRYFGRSNSWSASSQNNLLDGNFAPLGEYPG